MATLLAVLLINNVLAEVPPPDSLSEKMRVNGDWDQLPLDRKVKVFQQLEEESVLEELKELLGNLNEDDLDHLEDILTDNLDQVAEFKLMMDKLKDIGLEENHIQDIYNKAQLINEFLLQIPNISSRLGLDGDLDLFDHIQLYLLGLPNKLGPLGFIALRHILLESTESSDDSEDEIVDVIVEPFDLPSSLVDAGEGAATAEETGDANLRRSRRQAQVQDHQQALLAHQAAENAVLRQQGLDPALLDHQQALQAHRAAESGLRAQHHFVGLVGPSGSIGPSGLVGPGGSVQFRNKRNTAQTSNDQQQALLAHQAAENAVLRQQGLDPALIDHQRALQAHRAAESAVKAQHNFVGVVGPSGNIGPSGLVGPSGAVQFGKNRAAGEPGINVQHQQALDAHKAAEIQVLRQQGRDPALLNHQQALLDHRRAELAVRAQQINAEAEHNWGR